MSDEGLRAAYERALATRTPGERAACPAPEAILALVRRQGREAERLAQLDHIMACAACREEFELLRAIERAGEKAAAAEHGPSSEPGPVVGHIAWRRWVPLAAAAALVLVIAVGPGRQLWKRAPEQVRGGAGAVALIGPADGSAPAGATVGFVWHASPGAERYTLELLTGGGNVALSRTTTDTALTVVLRPALPAGDYRWWVSATSADGSETRSATRVLRLRRM